MAGRRGANGGGSQREDAYDTVLSAIIFGDLPPASAIDEKRIAAEFGLGLAAVRDALNRLALECMVERHARVGTYVPELGLRELQEVFEARILLEGACAGLAAERASAADVAALRGALADFGALIAAREFRELVTRDRAFHHALARACRNGPLGRTLVVLHNAASRFWYYGIQRLNPEALFSDIAAHVAVVDAIEARDPGEAERLMRTLLGHFPDFMRDVLVGSPMFKDPASLRPRVLGRPEAVP